MTAMAHGFADPVYDSQASFRSIMHALATPGARMTLRPRLPAPAPVNGAAAAALLALCDFETTLWLAPSLAGDRAIADYLTFHTGTRLVAAPDAAAFALVDAASDSLDLSRFAQGTPAYPDRSTTVVILCASLDGEAPLVVRGPGISHQARIGASPLPADFALQWDRNRAGFPLGVDLIFTCGQELVALPRSARRLAETH